MTRDSDLSEMRVHVPKLSKPPGPAKELANIEEDLEYLVEDNNEY